MMTLRQRLTTALVLLCLPQLQAATLPVAVSPGGVNTLTSVEARCPTFSWGAVDDAIAHQIVVYAIDELGKVAPGDTPVLRVTLPGSASSWTPSIDQALAPGQSFAWSVRALNDSGAAHWSAPKFFRIAAAPPAHELSEALEIVRRYADGSGSSSLRSSASPVTPGSVGADAASENSGPFAGAALGGADFSIDSFGNVLGTSFGGDGSGLTDLDWSNLVNVPAGFADGTDDEGIAYAAGNQLSLNVATFNVVEGSGSDLNADMLDGRDYLYFAAQATTYTKTEVDALLTVDNISAPIPGSPRFLRIEPDHRIPGQRRLSWNMDSLAGVASFAVYQAHFPITDDNKTSTQRQVTSSLYAAVDLFPGSGLEYFRVEAVNVLGEPGPLSPELIIDTTSRLAYLTDQRASGLIELFTASSAGGPTTRVSGDLISFGDVREFSWSPRGASLAYLADQETDEVYELYVVAASGGSVFKVNSFPDALRDVFRFAWAPDASWLAYIADQDINDVFELYIASEAGTVKMNDPLVAGGDVVDFAWSPNGSQIAYLADQDTNDSSELFVASGTGTTKVSDPLVSHSSRVVNFAWSPDGSRLAYRADQDTFRTVELYVVPATGGGSIKLNGPLVEGGDVGTGAGAQTFSDFAAWSPDGSRLAYRADQEIDEVHELYVVPASGGSVTKVSGDLGTLGDVADFAWSPDGSRLAYLADQDTGGVLELYVVPASGGGATKVSHFPDGYVYEVAWSPDGSRLAYDARQDPDGVGELYVVPASGGGATKISDDFVSGGGLFEFAWSPDGARLAYSADQETDNLIELYVVPASGGDVTKVSGEYIFSWVRNFGWSPLGVE